MSSKKEFKEFFATSWAIDNKASIYVLIILITILGINSYINIPKEQFPEIVIPTILVSTPYPGTSPEDIENLVSRPIEKQIKSLQGVKKVSSNSIQDFSSIAVEFNTEVDVAEAKQRVKDAVDKARQDLPTNLPTDPNVMEIDFSEIPILFIQLSGDYDLASLKKYSDKVKDKIESLKEITRVDIVGALEREIYIDIDMYKMQAYGLTFSEVERAVMAENMTISAGKVSSFGMDRSIRVRGQIDNPKRLNEIAFQSTGGAHVFLRDFATIYDGFKKQENFSRLNNKPVITLNVIKKSGQNLIEATDNIKETLDEIVKSKVVPSNLKISLSGEMARYTRNTLDELNNTIVIAFLLVTLVLMFFMGFRNAFFVGLAAPLSMFIAYMIMPSFGFTMNMIVMFAFIFALGIVVDDAIVVIENTHRWHRDEPDIAIAAKKAAGEVFLPILSGTLTTLAPFFPLAFWPGIVGKFMYYMPVTLIITLFASLFVAYVINPVFAVKFMKREDTMINYVHYSYRKLLRYSLIFLGAGTLFYLVGWRTLGHAMGLMVVVMAFYHFILKRMIYYFQRYAWPWAMKIYERSLRFFIRGRRPYWLLAAIIGLFIATLVAITIRKPQVVFFPDNEPNTVEVLVQLPVGTAVEITDSVVKIVEKKILTIIGSNNPIVESIISNVALGAGDGMSFDRTSSSNKGKVTINFVEHRYRDGLSTSDYMEEIREKVRNIPGVEIRVQKNRMGPPTGKPINIEITGDNLDDMIAVSEAFIRSVDSSKIKGIEDLKSDFDKDKPEIIVEIDRIRANNEGLTTAQIGMEIRTAVFGKEVSKYKEVEDEFPIIIRLDASQRENVNTLMGMKITYRDMGSGRMRQIPLSSVAKISYSNTYGGIKRKDMKRVITLSSGLQNKYSANDVLPALQQLAKGFSLPQGVEIKFTGEREDQAEASKFLFTSLLIAIGLIFFILITQFNSFSKTLIILSEVLFSIIGVLLGILIFNMSISIIMTGLGIVALGGIVVRNGILIVEFIDLLKSQGMKTRDAIVEAGKTRITPVILTAATTILGLIPLAIGFNINFFTLLTDLNPNIHFGGDNVMFWGPLSWTIVFGLSFATFLTLIFVPAMYFIAYAGKIKVKRFRNKLRS